MAEIRAIRDSEADEFLRVMCKVFSIDHSRARSVFFNEPFFDLGRKLAVFEDGRIISTLTTVPLQFGDGPAFGIAGVSTIETHRGRGIAAELIRHAIAEGAARGESRALLFAATENLYAKCGFTVLDRVVSQPLPEGTKGDLGFASVEEIVELYTAWSEQHPVRLRRDESRWKYWKWNMKTAYAQPQGYVCYEFGRVREILPSYSTLPFSDPAEWFGLESMATLLGVPLHSSRSELLLMGYGFAGIPQMFMTDQF